MRIITYFQRKSLEINKKLQEDYTKVLKMIQKKYKSQEDAFDKNKYLEYDKFKNYLNMVDFDKLDVDESDKTGLAILFFNSLKFS